MLLFCSRSLFLSNRSSFFYSRSLFLTGLAGSTLRLNLFTLAFLCISSLLVSLLSLTLLNTLSDSSAASVKDYLNTMVSTIPNTGIPRRLASRTAICSFSTSTTKSALGRRVRSAIEPRFFSNFAR